MFAAACFIGLVKRFAVGFWIAVAILSYAVVLAVKQSLDASYDLGLLRCLGGFCVGIAIAKFIRIESVASWFNACGERTMTLITGGIVLWIVVALSYVDGYSEAVLLPAFAALILILHRDSGAVAGALKSAPLAFLGRVSYSVYMIHVPVLMVALSVLKRLLRTGQDSALKFINPWLGDGLVILIVLVVIVIAKLTYDFLETPGRNLGRRLVRRGEVERAIREKAVPVS